MGLGGLYSEPETAKAKIIVCYGGIILLYTIFVHKVWMMQYDPEIKKKLTTVLSAVLLFCLGTYWFYTLFNYCFFHIYFPLSMMLHIWPLMALSHLYFYPKTGQIRAYYWTLVGFCSSILSAGLIRGPFITGVIVTSGSTRLNINPVFGMDGISLLFIILTNYITLVSMYYTKVLHVSQRRLGYILLIFIQFCLIGLFTTFDLLVFYIYFEMILIPMVYMIGGGGPNQRRFKANYYFILYSIFGSLLLLFGILYVYSETGTTCFLLLKKYAFDKETQRLLGFVFFFGFATKVPIMPFHLGLPEAHVEAPTIGSVLLAALLLKIGGYGMLRICIPLFPMGQTYFLPLIYTLCFISIVIGSLSALVQIDIKRIIAYSSIVHMNLAVFGLFSNNAFGITGAIVSMFAHGLTSAGLFFAVGMLYQRYHTKLLPYYGGLSRTMPSFANLILLLAFGNLGIPGTVNFIGEFLTYAGLIYKMPILTAILLFLALGNTAYTMGLINRILFGELKTTYISEFSDLIDIERHVLGALIVPMVFFGLRPNGIIDLIIQNVQILVW